MLIGVTACSAPDPWTKSGAVPADTATDLAACRQFAKAEADRRYVFSFPFPYPLGWGGTRQPSYLEWQQRFEAAKAYGESNLTTDCMRERGYRALS